jgi:hypothetical protein
MQFPLSPFSEGVQRWIEHPLVWATTDYDRKAFGAPTLLLIMNQLFGSASLNQQAASDGTGSIVLWYGIGGIDSGPALQPKLLDVAFHLRPCQLMPRYWPIPLSNRFLFALLA